MGTGTQEQQKQQSHKTAKMGTPRIKHREVTEVCHSRWGNKGPERQRDKSRVVKPNTHEKRCMNTESDTQCEKKKKKEPKRSPELRGYLWNECVVMHNGHKKQEE
jgi:hypothetical protein